jgi:hypothetical protein
VTEFKSFTEIAERADAVPEVVEARGLPSAEVDSFNILPHIRHVYLAFSPIPVIRP